MGDKKQYEVLVGMNYGKHRREPGDVVDDLPKNSVGWLLDAGYVKEVADDGVPQRG